MARPKSLTQFDKRAVAAHALRVALELREHHNIPDYEPLCPFDACSAAGISVRFVDLNMDGIYFKGTPPRILLSAHRPLVRRVFTCAHELGHHLLGHGSRLDQLHDRATTPAWEDPEEFAADTIAAHLLMPTIGIRRALNIRKWALETMTPAQLYTLACDFGVGYETLITHLSVGIREISLARATELQRATPQSLRRQLLKTDCSSPLIICSPHRAAPWLDLEVDTFVLVPSTAIVTTPLLTSVETLARGQLFRAKSAGIAEINLDGRLIHLRVMSEKFVGLARYRHLESCE